MQPLKLFCSLCALLAVGGCAGLTGPKNAGYKGGPRADHSAIRFELADFYKPSLESTEPGLAEVLAPLIMQEVTPGQKQGAWFQPTAEGMPSGTSAPTVYWHADSTTLNGNTALRFSYAWFYKYPGEVNCYVRGVRVTLDQQGKPVLWELLSDAKEERMLIAARSLETAAEKEFGGALPGRHHALEGAGAAVARIIDDGPVPMGPVVYLRAERHRPTTVICRCMPPQARGLRETALYRLAPASELDRIVVEKARGGEQLAAWLGWIAEPAIEERIRVPAGT